MPSWAFVADMASAAPTVLLNLNATPWFVGNEYNLDPPGFTKGRAGGSLRVGQRVTNSKPNNRTLVIPLQLLPTSTPGAAIEALCEQLARNNILKVQFHTADPVFFRTLADPDQAIRIRSAFRSATTITLEIEAEPYAYGVREEVTGSPFTVSNNPAAGNGCFFDADNIKGDSETPLLLLATSTGASGAPSGLVSKQAHFASRRRGTPSGYSNVMQGESMTMGSADTTAGVDAAMSNGNRARCTFATTAAMALRVSDTFPADGTSTVEARGEYRVYARLQKTVSGDVIKAQLKYGSSSGTVVANDEVTMPSGTVIYWADLGLMPVPMFADGNTMGFSGVQTKALMTFVGLYLQRVSGSGSVDIDVLYFMPADEPTTLICKFPATDTTYAIDGTTDSGGAVYALNTALDAQLEIGAPPAIVGGGGFPAVIPGFTNRFHILRHVDPLAATVDAIGNTTTIRAFYWPRWLNAIRT